MKLTILFGKATAGAIVLISVVAWASPTSAIPPNYPDIPIHIPTPTAPAEQRETSIAVSPLSSKTVLASAVAEPEPESEPYDASAQRLGFYVSLLGGTVWSPADDFPSSPAPMFECPGQPATGTGPGSTADPLVAIDRNGVYYIAGVLWNGGYITIARSTNNGVSWQWWFIAAPAAGQRLDKPHLAVDNFLSSPHKGNLYCAWTKQPTPERIEFARKTPTDPFDTTVGPNCDLWTDRQFIGAAEGAQIGVNVQVGPEGHVYACWVDGLNPELQLWFNRSSDAGVTWESPRVIQSIWGLSTGGTNDPTLGIYVKSWPAMATDLQRPGRLWIAWVNRGIPGGSGGSPDVYLMKSDDSGATWQTPEAVTQDSAYEFCPWIAADPIVANSIHLSYFHATNPQNCEYHVAHSPDGGATWTYKMPVSDAPFQIVPTRTIGVLNVYGEYSSIAVRAGRAYPLWFSSVQGSPVLARTSVIIPDNLTIRNTILPDDEFAEYETTDWIEAGAGFVARAGSTTTLRAEHEIRMTATAGGELRLEAGCDFHASIGTVEVPGKPTPVVDAGQPTAKAMMPIPIRNWPNPFNPSTRIEYTVRADGPVRLSVYDILGRRIAVVVDEGHSSAGDYSVEFNGSQLASGVYYYLLTTKTGNEVGWMTLVK